MSRTALWIALSLVAALGLLALALSVFVGDPFENDRTLLKFDPAHAASLRIEEGGRAPVEFVRDRGESWTMSARVSGGAPWPAAAPRVRTALRLLADARPLGDATAGLRAADDAVEITITLRDGASKRVRLSPLPLGGRALAELEGGERALVDAALLDVLRIDSALAWRSISALPGVTGDASRVRIGAPDRAVGLAKTLGVWSMREPAPARANQAAALALLDALSRLTVVRFVDDPGAIDAHAAGVAQPRWTIDVEHDVRTIDPSGDVSVRTIVSRLAVGVAADAAGDTAYASPDGGRTLMVVRVDSLHGFAPDPLAFVARNAVDTTADNVGMIFIARPDGRESGYRSGLDGWRELHPDGSFADVPDERVRELLEFLSLRIAPVVEIGASEAFRPGARLLLFGFTDDPLESVEFGAHPDHPGAPAVRSADAVRVYTGAAPPPLIGG